MTAESRISATSVNRPGQRERQHVDAETALHQLSLGRDRPAAPQAAATRHAWMPGRDEPHLPLSPLSVADKHPVHHHRMQMHIQIERRPEPLHDHHRPAASVDYPAPPGLTPQPADDGADKDCDDRSAQIVVPREPVP